MADDSQNPNDPDAALGGYNDDDLQAAVEQYKQAQDAGLLKGFNSYAYAAPGRQTIYIDPKTDQISATPFQQPPPGIWDQIYRYLFQQSPDPTLTPGRMAPSDVRGEALPFTPFGVPVGPASLYAGAMPSLPPDAPPAAYYDPDRFR